MTEPRDREHRAILMKHQPEAAELEAKKFSTRATRGSLLWGRCGTLIVLRRGSTTNRESAVAREQSRPQRELGKPNQKVSDNLWIFPGLKSKQNS
jgi:hypothetical protein